MQAAERTISDILSEQVRYQIPPYQRPYSWEVENVTNFLEDIWEAFQGKEKEYFIGSLITIELEKKASYDVVDGQQRLTTINLILARLRYHIQKESAKSEIGKRILPRNELTGETEQPRLAIRGRDQAFFYKHVLCEEIITKEIENKIRKEKDAPKIHILENMNEIDNFCLNKGQETLMLFANYLLSNVYVVFVTTESIDSAYRLFNVMNARGMQLSNADLIKNSLFNELGNASNSSSSLEEKWLELESIISISQMDSFLSHHRTSIIAQKANRTLNEEFKPIIEAHKKEPLALIEKLISSAENYARIQNNEFEDARTKRAIKSLKNVVFEEWIPPLLAYLNSNITEKDIPTFVVLLEKITIQNWVRRLAFTARLTVYFQIINAIKEKKGMTHIEAIVSRNSNNKEFLTLINNDVYGKPFARAILLALEEANQDESVTKSYSGKITIEHVLPQKLKDPYWRKLFTDEQHQEWIHKIGNLALLSGTKNYKAQYYCFDKKREVYAEREKKVSFDTTKEILTLQDWDVETIEKRQENMLEKAKKLWYIKDEDTVKEVA